MMLGGFAGVAAVMCTGGFGVCGRNSVADVVVFFGGLLTFLGGLLVGITEIILIAIEKCRSNQG